MGLLLANCSENVSEPPGIPEAMQQDLPEDMKSERTPVEIKTATCLLWPSNFRGDCNFEPRGRGSFSVTLPEGEAFYDDVTQLLVTVYMEGHADVRAMKADGTSEMVGEAKRSETYPACWIGTGFSVCAY
ncbi:hypothetical protein [Parvularcula lutaonensis]|uniref:Uncharacterized protein n=1 Tax=Parvularcula lutaonensis TaxID=491923 RepID=A0ABV7MBK5_9PROT|nr:hypothetical protein [Parvularcula lutaonensis]